MEDRKCEGFAAVNLSAKILENICFPFHQALVDKKIVATAKKVGVPLLQEASQRPTTPKESGLLRWGTPPKKRIRRA